MKKNLCKVVIIALLCTSSSAHAGNGERCGYEECRRAPCMVAAAVALGAVALAAMVAIVISDASCSHSHCGCQ